MMELCRMPIFITMVPMTLAIQPTMRTSSVRVPDATSADIRKLIKSQLIGLSKSGPILPSISKLTRTSSDAYFEFRNPTPEPSELLQNITWPQVSTQDGDFYYVDITDNLEIKNHPKESTYSKWVALYYGLDSSDWDTF
jgi:hypothetical protein